MIDSSLEDGGSSAPDMGMERTAKLRTISCSTEESGVDSSSLPSVSECSSPNTVSTHSEPESDTSDYPRSSPSPAPAIKRPQESRAKPVGLNNVQRAVLTRRRATLPPSSGQTTQNLNVSLPKLSLPPEEEFPQSNKKIRLDPDKSPGPSQDDRKCNVKVLPKNIKLQNGNFKVKSECESQKSASAAAHFSPNNLKTDSDEMKMEIAQIDSILQGKLLLEKSSHKLCDMVGMGLDSKVKQEFNCSFDKKHLEFSSLKNEKSSKMDAEDDHSNNNYNLDNKLKLEKVEEDEHAMNKEQELVSCKWEGCGARLRVQHLLDHLSSVHVTPQKTEKSENSRFQCLWVGCKVFSTGSTSYSWLSSHVTSHVGKKPFICMVDGCTQRFSSQLALSRHVNSHFKNPCPSTNSQPRKGAAASPIKFYIRKNRRKIKPAEVRNSSKPELFHIGIMAGIKDGLSRISGGPNPQQITLDQTGSEIIFHHRIKSRKLDENGNIQYLVTWLPEGMFPEEWISKKNLKPNRRVTLSQASPVIKEKVEDFLFGKKINEKHPRKPERNRGPPKLT